MNNLGNVLARLDPPDLAAARGLWERAAAAGDTGTMELTATSGTSVAATIHEPVM